MSISLMTLAFRTTVTAAQKIVLLALCDSANDQGECYPSIPALIAKCSLSERTVQKAISDLEIDGHLRREFRTGRSTIYWMHPVIHTPATDAPRNSCTPAIAAPTPATGAPPPPQLVHPTPAIGAPITIKEPSIEPSRKRKSPEPVRDEVGLSELVKAGFDAHTAQDFLNHKRAVKAPLTRRAWQDHQREAGRAGWTVQAAAEKVMARSWKGFEAKYVADQPKPSKAKQTAHAGFDEKDYRAGVEDDGTFT